jgi:hypothetical protein
MAMFEDEDGPYEIEVEAGTFCSVCAEAIEEYRSVADEADGDPDAVDVEVEKYVEDRPQRFHPFSTKVQGPTVVIEYELEYGRQTVRTRQWAEYREQERDEALEEAAIDEMLPDAATVLDG